MRLFAVLALALPLTALAAPPKAAVCAGCHGPKGISQNPEWPNIAGQKKPYLISSMKAYRDGSRSNELMSPIAKDLSDEEIEALASHFSSLSPAP